MFRAFRVPAVVAGLLLSGCAAQIGPQTIPHARFDYGEALARSWNEQLLLNLVCLSGALVYIADTDLGSKTTFSLLTYLFSLKAGNQEIKEPVLTLGVR